MTSFNKVLNLFTRNGFIKTITGPNDKLRLGPSGFLLEKALQNEWNLYNLMYTDMNIILCSDFDLENKSNGFFQCQLPFGVATTNEVTKENISNDTFESYFKPKFQTILKCDVYISSKNATKFFHQWQKQRKVWWRKFSALPERYMLTDIQQNNESDQHVEILSNYSWGTVLLETIKLSQIKDMNIINNIGIQDTNLYCVTSEMILQTMLMNSLCDAYDEPVFKQSRRELLRLHRKLAPYKICFTIIYKDLNCKEELLQLAQYLCKLLRIKHISTLFLPHLLTFEQTGLKKDETNIDEDEKWHSCDQLGIPYSIVLRDGTLKNGLCGLRSRDTTLEEEIHVSDIPEYIEKLFKNY